MAKLPAGKARLMLTLEPGVVRRLKVRAAEAGRSVSWLVTAWVGSWPAPGRRRPGGRR